MAISLDHRNKMINLTLKNHEWVDNFDVRFNNKIMFLVGLW
jgi:hypothetical protein